MVWYTHLRKYSSPTRLDSRNDGRNLTEVIVSWSMARNDAGYQTYRGRSLAAELVAHSLHAGMTVPTVAVGYQTRNT